MNKLGFTLLIFFTTSLLSQNVNLNESKMNYGEPYLFLNARSLGMGGSGIADGSNASDFLLNPALGVLNTSEFSFSAKNHFDKYQEDRAFPYYDSFGGFVDYGSYVFNENWYNNFSGSVNYALPEDLTEGVPISIALAINPFLDFNYEYAEEVRTTGFNDNILAYNKIQSDGILQEISFNLASEPIDDLAIGVNVGIINGEIDQSSSINPKDDNLENLRHKAIKKIGLKSYPIKFNFGINYIVTEFVSFGSKVSLPYTLKLQTKFNLESYDSHPSYPMINIKDDSNIEYPLSLGFGLNYKFTNILLARLNFDFEYTFWSDIKDNLNPDLRFEDTYRVMVGVEHIFMDKVPFRLGFNYAPLRENKNITKTIFTAGTGMVFDNFTLELSAGISSLTYNQLDMYDNALYGEVSRGENALDRVETDSFFGLIELNYFLDL
jgi:hypothetical protein